jgi:hypothetical protein
MNTTFEFNMSYAPNQKFSQGVHELDIDFEKTLPLNIYEDLPAMPHVLGNMNGDRLFQVIADAYPEGTMYPQCRGNRRKLYMSIYFLRTASRKSWVCDVPVRMGQYTKDALVKKGVVGMQHMPSR